MPRLFLFAVLLLAGCAISNHEKNVPPDVSAGHQIPLLDNHPIQRFQTSAEPAMG